MRILDRYIVKQVSLGYFFVLATFIGLYLIIDLFTNLSNILKSDPPFYILAQYYIYSLPLIIKRVSPLSILISTLYTFGELNKNNETISIRTSGLSILRVAYPVIFFALVISASVFTLQEKVLIHWQKRVEDIKSQFIKKDLTTASEERNFAFTSGSSIFFVGRFVPQEKMLENVMIYKRDKDRRITKRIVCKKVSYEYGFWIGQNIIEYSLDSEGNEKGKPLNIAKGKIDLKEKPRELILKKSIFAEFSSLQSLKKEIDSLKRLSTNEALANLIIDYYHKMTEPFIHLFLVIGILPLALEIRRRKVALSSLGVGFIFGFIYYVLSSFSIALGKSGFILPFFSAWTAPFFFLTVGITGLLLIK